MLRKYLLKRIMKMNRDDRLELVAEMYPKRCKSLGYIKDTQAQRRFFANDHGRS